MQRKVNNCAVLGIYDVTKIIDIRIVDGATFWCCMRIADCGYTWATTLGNLDARRGDTALALSSMRT